MSPKKFARKCSECNSGMDKGWVINGGEEYYCSDKCLHKHYTEKEYLDLYDDGNGDSYWTEWEDDMQYVLIDNELTEIDE